MSGKVKLALGVVVIALAIAGTVALLQWKGRTSPEYLRLADGTEIFFRGDSKVEPAAQYPRPREIAVDGEFFFRVAEAAQPLIVRSRLLVLTVTGKTAFRITAHAKEAGE